FGVPITQYDSGEIKHKSIAMTRKNLETEMTSNKRSKIVLESNNSHELKIEEQKMKL
ncbi:16383_t:CDS:2, partial [Cetraspora pellucida]